MVTAARLWVVKDEDTQADSRVQQGQASDALTQRLAARHRDLEDLLVELDRGESEPQPLLQAVQRRLDEELGLWQQAIVPMVVGLGDQQLTEVTDRLHAARTGLTRALPASSTEAGFRARVARLCERLEMHHGEEEELVLLPLRQRLLSARG